MSDCQYPKVMYSESSAWGNSWNLPEIISGPTETSEYSPFLFYNRRNNNPIFHCVMFKNLDSGNYDLFYMRSEEIVTVSNGEFNQPSEFEITIYPNPFNSGCKITVSDSNVESVRIYDITGRLVETIELSVGQAVWDASKYSAGIYLAKAKSGDSSVSVKLIYLK